MISHRALNKSLCTKSFIAKRFIEKINLPNSSSRLSLKKGQVIHNSSHRVASLLKLLSFKSMISSFTHIKRLFMKTVK